MKRIYCLNIILIFLFIFAMGSNAVTAKTLYDDFSGNYLDSSKWTNQEFVREVVDGKLVSKLGTELGGMVRNHTIFENSESIFAIQADVTPVISSLENGSDVTAVIRLNGFFYNTQSSGEGATGDVFAAIQIKDNGDELVAEYFILEFLDDSGSTSTLWANDTIPMDLSYNQTYTMKIEYNEDLHQFTLSISGVAPVTISSASLPSNSRAAVFPNKYLTTGINNAESGVNFVHALFDNVYINNQGTVYDNFSTSPLDQTKWQELEFVREIENGKLRLTSHSTGDRASTTLNFAEISPYTEVTVTIKSSSQLEPGDRAVARIIDGNFYNTTHGPGSYNGNEGEVWVEVRINYESDGTLKAYCYAEESLDADWNTWETLFNREFFVPIVFDRAYRFSFHFDGSSLRFSCQDTVTGREDIYRHEIITDIYDPYNENTRLLSRVYGNAAGGYMAVEFDDVYVDVAEPPAIYDATGDWEVTDSDPWSELGCDLPDVDGATNVTITQNGNDFTLVVHTDEGDFTFDGVVYGNSYQFMSDVEIEGDREVNYGVFHLSQAISGTGGTGSFLSHFWTDDIYQCRNGSNITLASLTDTDGDGISDFIESSGPNSGDANYDTEQDSGQPYVASLKAYNSQEYVVLETPVGTVLSNCQAAENPSPGDTPAKMNFDYGFFSFTISGLDLGGSTTLTMTLPDGVTVDSYYKYGMTPANPNANEWYEFLYDANTDTGVEINNNVLTFHFVDALRGDDILVQDSMVIDVGAPAFAAAAGGGGGGGGGGGCFISTMNK